MNFQIENNLVTAILTNGSCRTFRAQFPKKFNIHGFGTMDVVSTLQPKILSGDYSSCVGTTQLSLGFTINNTKKEAHYVLCLEEVFDPINLTEIPNDLKPQFMCLQNQINYLKSKLETLAEENENLKHKDYYDYDG
jgi:hypothetical protein